MTPISNPFRPEKDKTLVKSSVRESRPILMRTTSTAAAGLNESFQEVDKVRIMAHGGIAQLLLPLGPSVWRAHEVSRLVPMTAWAALRCFSAVSDGWSQLFVFLSSLRPTDKAQAEGWVTSSVKMCGIILLLLLSWQREDTWQMLFCSLMQAFFFFFPFLLSNCFGICRMDLVRQKKTCVCVYFSHERPNIYLNTWVWLLRYQCVTSEMGSHTTNYCQTFLFLRWYTSPTMFLLCGWILWNLSKTRLGRISAQNYKTDTRYVFAWRKLGQC